MSTTRFIALGLTVLLAAFGCDSGSDSSANPTPDMGGAGAGGQGAGGAGAGGAGGMGAGGMGAGGMGAGGQGAGGMGAGGAGGEPAQTGRSAGRMTLEQLARSIPIVTDGLRWTENFGNGPVDMLEVLAPTMGAPDYRNITVENLEPTLIIAKFMQDASHRICVDWVARDAELAAGERTLVKHADWNSVAEADVKQTLRALQLRFFARMVAPDDDAPIAALYELFQTASGTAAAGREASDGWTAVCIALMTDPEFVIY